MTKRRPPVAHTVFPACPGERTCSICQRTGLDVVVSRVTGAHVCFSGVGCQASDKVDARRRA